MKKLFYIFIIASIVFFSAISIAGHRMRIDGSASIDCLMIDGSSNFLLIDGDHPGGGFHRPGRVLGGGVH